MIKIEAIAASLLALAIIGWAGVAIANACPYGTSYQCYQGAGGKVICGCGR